MEQNYLLMKKQLGKLKKFIASRNKFNIFTLDIYKIKMY